MSERPAAGPVAFVTGGNTGIGAAISRRLAFDGARVAVGFVEDEPGAVALAETLTAAGRPAVAVPCDVTQGASVGAALDRCVAELGAAPTILVNNAGLLERIPFLEIDDERWERTLGVSLGGTYRCSRLALPGMLEAGGGAIVNLASELVWLGGEQHVHYVAAKAGIVGFTRALAREVAPRIRVNAVAPGPTMTRMIAGDAIPDLERSIPLGRVGRPEDVAAAVSFLAGEDASYITGQVLGVNGGLVMA